LRVTGNGSGNFSGVSGLLRWLESAPTGTLLAAESVAELVRQALESEPAPEPSTECPAPLSPAASWRVELWRVPSDTRLGVHELAEAVGRSRDWVYRQTAKHRRENGEQVPNEHPIPHSKRDGALEFKAGQVRAWLREREHEVVPGPVERLPEESTLQLVRRSK
jgi:predicted transcriptional regulator